MWVKSLSKCMDFSNYNSIADVTLNRKVINLPAEPRAIHIDRVAVAAPRG